MIPPSRSLLPTTCSLWYHHHARYYRPPVRYDTTITLVITDHLFVMIPPSRSLLPTTCSLWYHHHARYYRRPTNLGIWRKQIWIGTIRGQSRSYYNKQTIWSDLIHLRWMIGWREGERQGVWVCLGRGVCGVWVCGACVCGEVYVWGGCLW